MGNKHATQHKQNLLFQSVIYEDYKNQDNPKYLEKSSIQDKKIKEKNYYLDTESTKEKSNYDEKFSPKKNDYQKDNTPKPSKQLNETNDKFKIDSEISQAFDFFQKYLIVKESECVKKYFIYFSI